MLHFKNFSDDAIDVYSNTVLSHHTIEMGVEFCTRNGEIIQGRN